MKMRILRGLLSYVAFHLCLNAQAQSSLIIDHTCTRLTDIPELWITKAKQDLHIFYGHTSHGSQLTVGGMASLVRYFGSGTIYTYGTDATDGSKLYLYEDFDDNDITKDNWIQPTRTYLEANPDCNVVMWSWCSFSMSTDFVQAYLDDMEQLITEYPNVRFVFMTGHNDQGETAQIVANRKQIREHCITHNRILYDFTDIEAYDPDGDFFGDWDASGTLLPVAQRYYLDMDISYNMEGVSTPEGNWGLEWMAEHPTDPLTAMSANDMCTDCAHSNGDDGRYYNSRIHCVLKGAAMWWLCARLAGWNGEEDQPDYTFLERSICEGESAFLGGALRGEQGTYYDTLTNIAGLDSIIITTLTVHPVYNMTEEASICQGGSIILGGSARTQPGTYTDTYTSVNGCDSIVTTTLTVHPVYNISAAAAICQGESIILGGSARTQPGTYTDTYTSVNGCDSIVTTTLTVHPVYNISTTASICQGESIILGGSARTQPGTYTDTYTSANGCDSVVFTTLTVNPGYLSNKSVTICEGESIFLGGAERTNSGTYTDVYQTNKGCDSTIITLLTVDPGQLIEQSVTICEGDSIFLAGVYQYEAGTYYDDYVSVNDCDSTVKTMVSVESIDTTVVIGDDLSAVAENVQYQWIDCESQLPVHGADDQVFLPASPGRYAVRLSNGSCSVVTNCHSFIPVKIPHSDGNNGIRIFPNPVDNTLVIDLGDEYGDIRVQLTDVSGRTMHVTSYQQRRIIRMHLGFLENGIYFLQLSSDHRQFVERIIKK